MRSWQIGLDNIPDDVLYEYHYFHLDQRDGTMIDRRAMISEAMWARSGQYLVEEDINEKGEVWFHFQKDNPQGEDTGEMPEVEVPVKEPVRLYVQTVTSGATNDYVVVDGAIGDRIVLDSDPAIV